MFFLRGRRRKTLLQTPLTDDQRRTMRNAAPLIAKMAAAPGGDATGRVERHEGLVNLLLNEKHFEGAGGLEITEQMKLCIAGQAALLQMRRGADYFPGLDTILVYPEPFVVDHDRYDEFGLVTEGEDELSGESWQRGAVVLAWSDVQRESLSRDGYNVVVHEFAHQLDDQTGTADGTPLLPDADLAADWGRAFQLALVQHREAVERDAHLLFDEDSAESPTEFFATAVELFFEFPVDLEKTFPDVYDVLGRYLELDPAAW